VPGGQGVAGVGVGAADVEGERDGSALAEEEIDLRAEADGSALIDDDALTLVDAETVGEKDAEGA
jgi:hypothetical protein